MSFLSASGVHSVERVERAGVQYAFPDCDSIAGSFAVDPERAGEQDEFRTRGFAQSIRVSIREIRVSQAPGSEHEEAAEFRERGVSRRHCTSVVASPDEDRPVAPFLFRHGECRVAR